MCIPTICTFPGNPRLSEVLPRLAPELIKAWVNLSQQAQEKSCPAQSQGVVWRFPHSLHNRDFGRAQLLTNNTLSSIKTLISSVLHRENTRSTGSCWTTRRSILWMDITNSGLSVPLFLGTPYCTSSSQVTTQPLPWLPEENAWWHSLHSQK